MKKIDITGSNFYIKEICAVRKNTLIKRQRVLTTKERGFDGFIYIIGGSCKYSFDDGVEFIVSEGDVLYLAKSSAYRMELLSEEYKVIYFNFLFDCEQKRQSAVYSPTAPLGAEALFRRMFKSYKSMGTQSHAECMSIAYSIYSVVITSANKKYINPSSREKISAVKTYIDRNCQDSDLSVSRIAEGLGMSEVYFRKLFKGEFNTSPKKYIIAAKIKHAVSLINSGLYTLKEIATLCGYTDYKYFSVEFKKMTGKSPSEYTYCFTLPHNE